MAIRTLIRKVEEPSLREFVRGEIDGYTALSEIVSKRIDLALGRFFLIMPEDFIPSAVEARGWNWEPRNVSQEIADQILAEVIASYLKTGGNRFLIQDYLRKRSDPCFEDDPLLIFHGDELYLELQGSEITEQKINVRNGSYWRWVGYFCKARETRDRFIAATDLEEVANGLVGVAVQALHDSYVFWWRVDLEPFPGVVD